MINEIKLLILDFLRPFFIKSGIDYPKMRLILETKFDIDQRKAYIGYQTTNKKDNAYTKMLLIHLIMGLMIALVVGVGENVIVSMTFGISFYLFIFFLSIISNFSTVILDLRDIDIIKTAPVSSKTIGAAKIMHIVLFIFILALVMGIPGMIAGTIKYNILFALVFLLNIIFISLFTVSFGTFLYYIILNLFDGEILKNIINYFQILLVIIMSVSYQIFGRLMGRFINTYKIIIKPIHLLLAPIWYSAPYSILFGGEKNPVLYIATLIGIIVPLFLTYLVSKNWHKFELNLAKLQKSSKKFKGKSIFNRIGSIITKKGTENSVYNFTLSVLSRERGLKTKLIPSLVLIIILPLFMIFNAGDLGNDYNNLNIFIISCFVLGLILTTFDTLELSENFEASWVFLNHEENKRIDIVKGICKAYLIKYITPTFVLANIPIIIISNLKGIRYIIIEYLLIIILLPFIYKISIGIPFSSPVQNLVSGSSKPYMNIVVKFSFAAVFGLLYYNFIFKNDLNYIMILIVMIILMILSFKLGYKLIKPGDSLLNIKD